DDGRLLRGGRLPGNDVRPVAVDGDHEGVRALEERAERVVAQADVVVADLGEERGQAVHLRVEGPGDDLLLRLVPHRGEVADRVAREAQHERAERGDPGGLDLQRVQPPGRVVAR